MRGRTVHLPDIKHNRFYLTAWQRIHQLQLFVKSVSLRAQVLQYEWVGQQALTIIWTYSKQTIVVIFFCIFKLHTFLCHSHFIKSLQGSK